MDRLLVLNAQLLTGLASKKRVQKELVKLFPARNRRLAAVEISGAGSRPVSRESFLVNELSMELNQVAAMATRDWTDLVNADDYFEPLQEHVEVEEGVWLQRGELIVSLNPKLHPIGNFVSRCMLRRIHLKHEALKSLRAKLLRTFAKLRQKYPAQADAENAWALLETAYAPLLAAHQTSTESQHRDSCMILTQVYAAFSPAPELSWLGLRPDRIRASVPHLKHRIQSLKNGEMFERIAVALGDLKHLYDHCSPDLSDLEEAIVSGALVIHESDMTVYWDGKMVTCEWAKNPGPWGLLLALAKKVRTHSSVTEIDLFGDLSATGSTMRMAKKRLRALLPPALGKTIIRGREVRSYRLDLEPSRVYLFD